MQAVACGFVATGTRFLHFTIHNQRRSAAAWLLLALGEAKQGPAGEGQGVANANAPIFTRQYSHSSFPFTQRCSLTLGAAGVVFKEGHKFSFRSRSALGLVPTHRTTASLHRHSTRLWVHACKRNQAVI